ncbi:EAL domain-containing protein [Synechococcus sp. CCY9202]|uniref:EAL domain-containing protein n=1 Tax=Synechococcus sp. CCY9202 TaxID=174698 RepID=UPI002B200A84|nr:EAL domain-containing protein [Synechococcus sp. CCY9202]
MQSLGSKQRSEPKEDPTASQQPAEQPDLPGSSPTPDTPETADPPEAAGSPGATDTTEPQPTPANDEIAYVVGLGASAGGLEALQELVSYLLPGGGVSYVVAQHLAPDHRSLLVDLVSHTTSLKVVAAVNGMTLQDGVIVICPPNHDVAVEKNRLVISEPLPRFGPSPSVDVLFESLAEHWDERAVGVVLSGTGSDGARGLRAVRAAGGLTLVQSPENARFDGMPRAAISLGGAELVLSAREIGQRLAALVSSGADWIGRSLPEPEPVMLSTISRQLKHAIGIDFSRYKETTLRRQVRRRMAIRQVSSIEDYLPLLGADPVEAHALAENLLVTVTSFFRNPDAFTALGQLLLHYLAKQEEGYCLRVWVPGCATGEEVYSLAMVVSELLNHPADLCRHLKIFGTDLDEASLSIARRAIYPISAAKAIPEALRAKFVTLTNGEMTLSETLRECAVFARHNVGEDPPFPRLDLISCRNTLIYFTAPLRDRVLSLFRYGLLPGGLLFLGSSESLNSRTAGFEAACAEQHLYRRTQEAESPTRLLPPLTSSSQLRVLTAFSGAAGNRVAIMREKVPEQHITLLEAMIRQLCHPCLILDEHHDLVEVHGNVTPYCRLPEGQVTTAASSYLRPELQAEARALFLIVRADGVPVVGQPLQLEGLEDKVRLEARPLRAGERSLTILSFIAENPTETRTGPVRSRLVERDTSFDQEVKRLEEELLSSQDSLHRSLAELESANEELEASSEELQASSEELQSSNEELEASNEELQATNEALGTLNQQLRSRTDELQALNGDMENIQSSVSQGMVIVDQNLRVTRFTPLAVRVFALVDNDIGQMLPGVPTTVPLPNLRQALERVIRAGVREAIEARGPNIAYLAQILPYRDHRGGRHGAIVTLTDVTELVSLRERAESSLQQFTQLTDALQEAVWKRDRTMTVIDYVSQRMQSLTGWSMAELLEHPEQLDEAIDPADRDRVNLARQAPDGWAVRYQLLRRDGQRIWVLETAKVISDTFVVGTLADINEQHATEERAHDMSAIFEAVFQTQVFGVAILDDQHRVVMGNEALCKLVNLDATLIQGIPISLIASPGFEQEIVSAATDVLSGNALTATRTLQLKGKDGQAPWVTAEVRRLPRPITNAVVLVIVQDVTSLRESTLQLERMARFDSATGLLNRLSFSEALNREIARSSREMLPLALAWVDLDHFKEINDQYGHAAGDEVLCAIGNRLQKEIRSGKDYVGRLGGDEFGVIIAGYADQHELDAILERLMLGLSQPILAADVELKVGTSVGVAIYGKDATTVDDFLRAADAAMYGIKKQGGNTFQYFTEAMNAAAEQRRLLRRALAEAIASESFELYYQPIVAATQGTLWGVEALIRWHRDGQVVSAGDFIEFAEQSGLIRELGPLTLRLLRADLERLSARGRSDLSVSLNMSVKQLEDPQLSSLLQSWPAAHGLKGLVVEVVESILLPDNSAALQVVHGLIDHGAAISIDDYGTGYSNLRLLKMLEPAFIKLDRSLLLLSLEDDRGKQLMRSAIELAHGLGAVVVVEGISDPGMATFCQELGADYLQGFAIARPMPLPDLLGWLESAHGLPA